MSIFLPSIKSGFIISAGVAAFIIITFIAKSVTEVSRKDNTIKIKDIEKNIQIDDIIEIKTWWNYDFGIGTAVFDNGPSSKSRMHENNINCFVKFIGKNECGYIYEQIVLSSKFPNNLDYLNTEIVDTNKLVKVWNIDNCLRKLELNPTAKKRYDDHRPSH